MELTAPRIPYISNLTGTWIDEQVITSPEYWLEQMCRTVRFADGIGELLKEKERVLIEVGAGQSLGSFVKQHPDYDIESSPPVIPVLRAVFHEQSDEEYLRDQQVVPTIRSEITGEATDEVFLLKALARLYVTGVDIDWNNFYANESRHRVALPTYPFERRRYWLDVDSESRPKEVHVAGAAQGSTLYVAAGIYAPSWTRSSPIRARRPEDFSWVVFTDETSSLSNQIVATLRSEGADPLCIPACIPQSTGIAMQHRALQGTYDRELLTEILHTSWVERRKPTRILYLWSLLPEPLSKETHQNGLDIILSATATAQMVDQAIECSYENQDCLALRVTNCAMRVTGYEVVQAERALLTVRNEGAADGVNIRRRSVDVIQPVHGSELEKDLAASILTEAMASSVGGGAVAIREGIWRWLPQPGLVHIGAGDSQLPAVSEAGNYLIAGDTTSIGITLAYQVACLGAASLIITSPYELPPRERWDALVEGSPEANEVAQWLWQIRVIEALGCKVHVLTADPDKTDELPGAVRQLYGSNISGAFYITEATATSKADAQNILRIRARRLAALHDAIAAVSIGFVVMLTALDRMKAAIQRNWIY